MQRTLKNTSSAIDPDGVLISSNLTVVYDACVLYPAPLRDLLIGLSLTGLFHARWTERILDECFRAILEKRPDLRPENLERTRHLMNAAVPDCLVEGYEGLEIGLSLPDSNDRHVLAAAIQCKAKIIITQNLKDFPPKVLTQHRMQAQHPDDFVLRCTNRHPEIVAKVVRDQAARLQNPPMTVDQVLTRLHDNGLVQTTAKLKGLVVGTS